MPLTKESCKPRSFVLYLSKLCQLEALAVKAFTDGFTCSENALGLITKHLPLKPGVEEKKKLVLSASKYLLSRGNIQQCSLCFPSILLHCLRPFLNIQGPLVLWKAMDAGVTMTHDMGNLPVNEAEAFENLEHVYLSLARDKKLQVRLFTFMPLPAW